MITGCANDVLRRGLTPSESNKSWPTTGLNGPLRGILSTKYDSNVSIYCCFSPLRLLLSNAQSTAVPNSTSGFQKSLLEFPPYTTQYPVFRASSRFVRGDYCRSITYYLAEAWKVCSWQSCASTARCAGSRRSSTHTSHSESTCYKAARWQTYPAGPRS